MLASFLTIFLPLLHSFDLASAGIKGAQDQEPTLDNGLIGTGFAYILWFAIIKRLPTATASLGSLATPVVGVSSSMLMLGERPTTEDMIGFALIFAAAVCALTPLDQEGPPPLGDGCSPLFLGTLRLRTETLARPNSSCEPRPAR